MSSTNKSPSQFSQYFILSEKTELSHFGKSFKSQSLLLQNDSNHQDQLMKRKLTPNPSKRFSQTIKKIKFKSPLQLYQQNQEITYRKNQTSKQYQENYNKKTQSNQSVQNMNSDQNGTSDYHSLFVQLMQKNQQLAQKVQKLEDSRRLQKSQQQNSILYDLLKDQYFMLLKQFSQSKQKNEQQQRQNVSKNYQYLVKQIENLKVINSRLIQDKINLQSKFASMNLTNSPFSASIVHSANYSLGALNSSNKKQRLKSQYSIREYEKNQDQSIIQQYKQKPYKNYYQKENQHKFQQGKKESLQLEVNNLKQKVKQYEKQMILSERKLFKKDERIKYLELLSNKKNAQLKTSRKKGLRQIKDFENNKSNNKNIRLSMTLAHQQNNSGYKNKQNYQYQAQSYRY